MVDAVFNVLNLLVRFGLVVFLIRKYVSVRIYQAIQNQKESALLLQEEQARLKESAMAVERSIGHQEILYRELQGKFLVWQQLVDKSFQQEQQVCVVMQKKIQLQHEMKQQSIIAESIMKKDLPLLIEETGQELLEVFQKNPEMGKKYITSILCQIREQHL